MRVSLLKLKNMVKTLEKGAKGMALSKIDVEFWLKRGEDSGDEVMLNLESVGQFGVIPDATFTFKVIEEDWYG